ncbi:methionyl-tRNA formyltransferase [Candidatus Hydrogenedentota bacterium]
MTVSKRIVFCGTPDFSVPSLRALVHSGHEVVAVVTQPDRLVGRGRKLKAPPVKVAAVELGIPVMQPGKATSPDFASALTELGPDYLVTAAYAKILRPNILAIPSRFALNVHASLLPLHRGAAPIQSAILEGDAHTGITVMTMVREMDAGDIVLQETLPILPADTAGDVHDKLMALGAEAIVAAIERLESGDIIPEPQDHSKATYCGKLEKGSGLIDWSEKAIEVERLVRAMNPWPMAFSHLEGEVCRIWSSTVKDEVDSGRPPGTVLACSKAGIDVQTGAGTLRIDTLQAPGKRMMSAAEYLCGHVLSEGSRFHVPEEE